MQSIIAKTGTTPQKLAPTNRKQQCIFALHMTDNRIVVGQSANASKIIQYLNAGGHRDFRNTLCVRRIIGIREVTETRTLPSVVRQFCNEFGSDRVVCI